MSNIDKSQFKISAKWVASHFFSIRINGQFRCDGNTWKKYDQDTALRHIEHNLWGARIHFPRREKVVTFALFLKNIL